MTTPVFTHSDDEKPATDVVTTFREFELVTGLRGLAIGRRDFDGRRRTVASIEMRDQWDRFVAALEAGADELAAVHAIDAEASR